MEGISSETINASKGSERAKLIQNLLDMSASSGFVSSPVASRGSRAIPQIGQLPGSERTISGCIGQVYSVRLAGGGIIFCSSATPHFGQLPGRD
jgi:hypothetical protein